MESIRFVLRFTIFIIFFHSLPYKKINLWIFAFQAHPQKFVSLKFV